MKDTIESLQRKLLNVTQEAIGLAYRLQEETANEDSPHYDRSRTWVDRHENNCHAGDCLRKLKPTERAMKKRLGME